MLNRINAIAYLLLNYIRTVIDIPTLQVRMRCRKYEGAKKMQQYFWGPCLKRDEFWWLLWNNILVQKANVKKIPEPTVSK